MRQMIRTAYYSCRAHEVHGGHVQKHCNDPARRAEAAPPGDSPEAHPKYAPKSFETVDRDPKLPNSPTCMTGNAESEAEVKCSGITRGEGRMSPLVGRKLAKPAGDSPDDNVVS